MGLGCTHDPPDADRAGASTVVADTYSEAIGIYRALPQRSQGVYRRSGLIFVIVVIDTDQEHLRYLEGTAMLRAVALLREAFPTLPPRFHARNRLVEKRLDDDTGIFRYALAFRESDILELGEQS